VRVKKENEMDIANYQPVRDTDPDTSHEAARKLVYRNRLQLKVLQVFRLHADHGATNEDVYAGWPHEREDTLRPRVAELRNAGYITEVGTRMGSRRRHITIWRITAKGLHWLEGSNKVKK
jgi:hypothetical protein